MLKFLKRKKAIIQSASLVFILVNISKRLPYNIKYLFLFEGSLIKKKEKANSTPPPATYTSLISVCLPICLPIYLSVYVIWLKKHLEGPLGIWNDPDHLGLIIQASQ